MEHGEMVGKSGPLVVREKLEKLEKPFNEINNLNDQSAPGPVPLTISFRHVPTTERKKSPVSHWYTVLTVH